MRGSTWSSPGTARSAFSLYLNGKLARSKKAQWKPSFASGMLIGANYQEHRGNFARGLIDEVRIYDQPLTAAQVQLLSADQFQAQAARAENSPPVEAADDDRPARETFHLSFDHGFEATAVGRSTPLHAAESRKLVDGVRGASGPVPHGHVPGIRPMRATCPKSEAQSRFGIVPDWKAHLQEPVRSCSASKAIACRVPTPPGCGSTRTSSASTFATPKTVTPPRPQVRPGRTRLASHRGRLGLPAATVACMSTANWWPPDARRVIPRSPSFL